MTTATPTYADRPDFVFAQTGFDTAVDDFYRVTRNSEEMMEQELVKFLAGLKCDVTQEMAKQVVDEIIQSKVEA
jgi:hypothetical protein